MTSFLSEWKHIATTKLEKKHSELIEERKVTVKLEKKHSELIVEHKVTVKMERKHFGLTEERKVTVKLESKHSEPIAMALQVEVTHQQCSREIPNP